MAELRNQSNLWKKFKRGNQSAFSTVYRQFYPSLYFYALKATANRDDAQECVQELFVVLWKSRKQLGNVTQIKPYLFKSLRGIICRHQTQQASFVSSPGEDCYGWSFSPEDFMIRQEDNTYRQDTLATVLNALPPRQREAVYLKYYEEMSYQQIAEVLHINYQSVVNLVYQAFQQLKQQPVLRKLVAQYHGYPLLLVSCLFL